MFVHAAEKLVVLISTPLYAVFILLELLLSNYQHRRLYTLRETLTNVYLTLLNVGLDALVRIGVLTVLLYVYQFRLFTPDKTALYWVALVVAEDFMYYWLHRIDHRCRLFWAVHVTHHSSEEFNLTTGFRSSVFQPLYRFIYFIPLVLAGFQVLDIMLVYAITQTWGILVHTQYNIRLGWLEYLLVTPSHHRVHHASNVRYLDKNMGMLLIIWDRMFGTFQAEQPDDPVRYGLQKEIKDRGPVNIVLHEFRAILHDILRPLPLKQRLQYLFAPPGWSHDGSTQTSQQQQRTAQKNHPI
jgi:sterol desaturase/sphingolipid hydroxylase (fatty acid hydroxylase superfamily)